MNTTIGDTERDEMTRQLSAHFVPQVARELEGYSSGHKVRIEHIPSESTDVMQMFNLVVQLASVDVGEMIELARHFHDYCWTHDKGIRLTDGRQALLGDGDDMGAVWYENGAIRIWLRVWAVGNDYGLGRMFEHRNDEDPDAPLTETGGQVLDK